MDNDILKKVEDFHDQWAGSIDIDDVLVDEIFENCTAPEKFFYKG